MVGGGWGVGGDEIRNLSSKIPTKFHETHLHLTILLLSELKKGGNYKVSSLKIRPEDFIRLSFAQQSTSTCQRPDWP